MTENPTEGTQPNAGPPEKTFTQAELNAFLAEDRRKTSAKYADYADLKAKATEYDQLAESQKSELQKVIDRATAAEKERDDLKAAEKARQDREAHAEQVKKWVAGAARKHGVDEKALRGDTEAEVEAHAEYLASLLPRKAYVPGEGERPSGDGTSEMREFARKLFKKE